MNRESERERIRTEHERTVGRYACKHGAWEPVENIRTRHEDAAELIINVLCALGSVHLIADTAYLMAAYYCNITKICECCPVAKQCMSPDNTERPAALLCRHFRSQAESKRAGEVPSWI